MRWVFVCTANIARSPYAERRLIQLLGAGSPVEVASAGIPGYADRPMDAQMAAQLEARGTSGAGHVSRILDDEILEGADLVLTMEFSHHMAILDQSPWAADRVAGLGQFSEAVTGLLSLRDTARRMEWPTTLEGRIQIALQAAARNSMVWDVADPYRRGAAAARKCAEQIDEHLAGIIRLFG